MSRFAPYLKAIIAVIGAALVVVENALADDVVSHDEWFAIVVAVLTAAGVYLFPNKPA